SIVTSLSRPRMPSARFTLRPNGEGGEERRIIMSGIPLCGAGAQYPSRKVFTLAGDDEVDRFRSLALLVRLDVEVDALAFVERLQARALDRRDVHEHIAPAVVRFDEPVAALAVEEFDRTTLRHR